MYVRTKKSMKIITIFSKKAKDLLLLFTDYILSLKGL